MKNAVEEPLFSDYPFDVVAPPAKPQTKANKALEPQIISDEIFNSPALRQHAYYADDYTILLNMDVNAGLRLLQAHGIIVNCIVTSPPFYGQRDYGTDGQIGLEEHPRQFIAELLQVFENARPMLAENGSMWVNLGDTYWSGKGEHKSGEAKQGARRFGVRPQDKKGDGGWCVPKQLLLIPHRFAIGMQDAGWIVRNDNVLGPHPDAALRQARDRCNSAHEYVFHLVQSRWYYFNQEAVGRKRAGASTMPPLDTWQVPTAPTKKEREQTYLDAKVNIPVAATTPPHGVVLDMFAQNVTGLELARQLGLRFIGIGATELASVETIQALAAH